MQDASSRRLAARHLGLNASQPRLNMPPVVASATSTCERLLRRLSPSRAAKYSPDDGAGLRVNRPQSALQRSSMHSRCRPCDPPIFKRRDSMRMIAAREFVHGNALRRVGDDVSTRCCTISTPRSLSLISMAREIEDEDAVAAAEANGTLPNARRRADPRWVLSQLRFHAPNR
mgnify:CR=1 FL=1